MTASSDPDDYGRLTAYVVNPPVDGPRTVSNQIDSRPAIAQQITLQTGGGNRVTFGDLQLVPVADGLLWVRPFYASVTQSSDRRHGQRHRVPVRDRLLQRNAPRSASRSARRWASCSPGSTATSATASVPTDGPPVRRRARTDADRRARRPSCWPRPTSCSPMPKRAAGHRGPRRLPGQDQPGQSARRAGPRRPRRGTVVSVDHDHPDCDDDATDDGAVQRLSLRADPGEPSPSQRGRFSSWARRARSSRKAIW